MELVLSKMAYKILKIKKSFIRMNGYVIAQLPTHKRTVKVNGKYLYLQIPNLIFGVTYEKNRIFDKDKRLCTLYVFKTEKPLTRRDLRNKRNKLLSLTGFPNILGEFGCVCLGGQVVTKTSIEQLLNQTISLYFNTEFVGRYPNTRDRNFTPIEFQSFIKHW
jgi:hypothetical protein